MSQLIVEADLIDLIKELRSRVAMLENRGELPIGIIIASAKLNPSNSWLLCDGTAYSRTTYAGLYGVIGDTFGAGDGSTTFNVPDLKGRVPLGVDVTGSRVGEALALGATGGSATHTLSSDEIPAHNHGVTDPGHTHAPGAGADWFWTKSNAGGNVIQGGATYQADNGVRSVTASSTTGITTNNTGAGDRHNNLQPFMALHFFIVAA